MNFDLFQYRSFGLFAREHSIKINQNILFSFIFQVVEWNSRLFADKEIRTRVPSSITLKSAQIDYFRLINLTIILIWGIRSMINKFAYKKKA